MDKIKGLSSEEVEEQIRKGNVNKLPKDNLKSNWKIIFDNVFTLFNLYNLIIAIALICVQAYTNVFFFLIITINVLIGIIQEIHGKNLVKKLSILSASKTTVMRNGIEEKIDVEEIVLGDTIVLQQGDQIPSDAYVVSGEIEANEALLTGESDLIVKKENDKLFSGSYVTSGKCYAIIEKVGEDNFANKIISSAKKQKSNQSELILSMKKITRFTSFVIIPFGIILFVQAYYTRQTDITQAVIGTAAALLGMLPKGLVLLITISLESGVIKLAKKQVLVQELYSIESLAHIDTICLDKTGTITTGKMKVAEVELYNEKVLPKAFQEMMVAFVNGMEDNNSTFKAMKDYFQGEVQYKVSQKIPFSSERKWSSISFESIGSIVMGAPEKLFKETTKKMPERGQIITFEAPSKKRFSESEIDNSNPVAKYENEPNNIFSKFSYYVLEIGKDSYIKRTIALPGEHVEIKDGKVYINGEKLEEPYLQPGIVTDVAGTGFTDFVVPENTVFAMGDNRNHSTDCRVFGCVPLERIESTVAIRFWPLDKWGDVD